MWNSMTDGILLDACRHRVKHLIGTHLVLNKRISLTVCLQADTLAQLIHIIDMIHPLAVDHLQKDHALQLTDLFWFRELRFLCLIQLDGLLP